jgi:hypothetical protein
MHIKLKDLIIEHPQLSAFINNNAVAELQKFVQVSINPSGMLGNVYKVPIDDDFLYVKGYAGGVYDLWIALFKRSGDGFDLCFISGLKQVNWNIDGLPTYSVKISNRFTDYPKRSAASTYLKLASDFPKGVVITSDTHVTDAGAWIWRELLTRPDVDVFVWNIETKRKETALDWSDVFGNGKRYADLVVALKTSSTR